LPVRPVPGRTGNLYGSGAAQDEVARGRQFARAARGPAARAAAHGVSSTAGLPARTKLCRARRSAAGRTESGNLGDESAAPSARGPAPGSNCRWRTAPGGRCRRAGLVFSRGDASGFGFTAGRGDQERNGTDDRRSNAGVAGCRYRADEKLGMYTGSTVAGVRMRLPSSPPPSGLRSCRQPPQSAGNWPARQAAPMASL